MLIIYQLIVLLTLTTGGAAGFYLSQRVIAQSLFLALFIAADILTISLGVYALITERRAWSSRQKPEEVSSNE